MGAKIARDRVALPIIGEMLARNNLQTAEFRIASGADAAQLPPHPGISEISRAAHAIADALPTRAVGLEGLAELVEVMSPGIAKAAQEHLQFSGRWTEIIDAATVQTNDAARRFE